MSFKSIIYIIVGSLLIISCNKPKTAEEIQKDWKTLESSEYSIKYPHTWVVNQTGYMGTSFLLISKQTSIRDFYQENVRLVIDTLDFASTSLTQYVQNEMKRLEKELPKFKVVNAPFANNDTTVMNLQYEANENKTHVFIESEYQLKNSCVYILTFSGKYREIKRYKLIGEGIIKSFEFK